MHEPRASSADSDIWEHEDAWRRARYSSQYVDYLRLTLPQRRAREAKVARARQALVANPIVGVILAHQQPDGSWPLGAPPWFRVYPWPLLVLLEYGMHEHPATQRGLQYLLSSISGGRFVWPRHEAHDPKEYYVAYQGRCLQVAIKAGQVDDPRVTSVAKGLIARQRWDGGWSIKPAWMYQVGEPRHEPAPSCWICTLEATRALGAFLMRPSEIVDRLLMFWRRNLNSRDVGIILALADFCAVVGMQAGDDDVDWLRNLLQQARGPDGRFPTSGGASGIVSPGLPEYFEVLVQHLEGRLGAYGQ